MWGSVVSLFLNNTEPVFDGPRVSFRSVCYVLMHAWYVPFWTCEDLWCTFSSISNCSKRLSMHNRKPHFNKKKSFVFLTLCLLYSSRWFMSSHTFIDTVMTGAKCLFDIWLVFRSLVLWCFSKWSLRFCWVQGLFGSCLVACRVIFLIVLSESSGGDEIVQTLERSVFFF